jgi:outer membrane protein assembly factor BamB
MRDLPADALFARDVANVVPIAPAVDTSWLADPANELVPLWQFRFRNPEPYKDPKASSDRNNVVFFDGVTTATMPYAGRYGPATWVTFARDPRDPQAAPMAHFLEHYCLRTTDAASGVLLQAGDGTEDPPVAREGHPRVRVAASDFALLRPVDDGERRYVVLGHPRGSTTSVEALKVSTLTAYDSKEGKRVWDSSAWLEGDSGLRDVTFLAAPTVFGERLMLPALRRGRYSLECLDRATGRPLWHAPLHGGGTPFFKAPGVPVVVQSGVAFVATNAGCIAAVDAFTGDLRWIRRYERVDPRRKAPKAKKAVNNDMGWGRPQFGNDELAGFLPNDLHVVDGLVIVAPIDSDMLLCLDGATGQPHWMLDGTSRYTPYGKLRSLVGRIGDDLFLVSETHLVGVGASGGLLKWATELPSWNGPKNTGRGRGAIAGGCIVIPGERDLLVYGTDGKLLRRAPMPAFDASRDPLLGSANVVVDGPWVAVGYQGGVEVFSSKVAIAQVAANVVDPVRKADLQLRAGDADVAIAGLAAALRAAADQEQKQRLGKSLLALTRDRAIALAKPGDAGAALALLDSVHELLVDRPVRMNWHLARVEICKDHGDLRAHEREQNRLYDYMEGRQ